MPPESAAFYSFFLTKNSRLHAVILGVVFRIF